MEFKKCGICGGLLPKEYFYKKGNGLDYRCKKCSNKQRSINIKKQSERGEFKKWNSNPIKKKCPICGKEFEAKTRSRVYCSDQCKRVGINRRMDKEFNERYKGYKVVYRGEKIITYKCLVCSNEYTLSKGQLSAKRVDGSKGPICWHCIEVAKEKKLADDREKREAERRRRRRKENAIKKERALLLKPELDKLNRIASNHRHYQKCNECGRWFFNRLKKKTCSIKCENRRQNRQQEINRRRKVRENGRIDWDINIQRVIQRDGLTCHICGEQVDLDDFYTNNNDVFIAGNKYPSIDHVKPVSKGGTHTWDNVKIAHRICNSVKSDKRVYRNGDGQAIVAF